MSLQKEAVSERKEGIDSAILVTGGRGFIGSHLVDRLSRDGYKVITFDNSTKQIPTGETSIKHIQGDIADEEEIKRAVSQSKYVFHLAGVLGTSETIDDPVYAVRENIFGALTVLEAIKDQGKRGTMITIGGIDWPNPYAITKKVAEDFSLMYQSEYGVDVKVVRGLNVYGPRQKHAPVRKAVPNFIVRALQNEPLEVFGDGTQILDLVYVEDMAEVMIRSMQLRSYVHHVMDAGTGKGITVNELARTIVGLTDSRSPIMHFPMRQGEPEHSVTLGDTRTLEAIGYVPSTPLVEGLRKTILWYKEHLPEPTSK
ncbi:MAG: SDR family NAD(P)-dependent oxidoreductase [Candidatus Levybacteria bacterium]|nr:SDR family NAD(P)-dependent oxidoreductase [Candidatus Levybacteria bacterium]